MSDAIREAHVRVGAARGKYKAATAQLHKVALSGHPEASDHMEEALVEIRRATEECVAAEIALREVRKGQLMATYYLETIIEILEKEEDQTLVCPLGFGDPHSYRGFYEDVAFPPKENVTVGEMLRSAKSAVGKTFEGYKGGEFTMSKSSYCWLAKRGDTGETLGPILLRLMLDYAKAMEDR